MLADELADALNRLLSLWQDGGKELPDVDHLIPNL